MSCNDAPCRSIEVATECRNKCAAPRPGRVISPQCTGGDCRNSSVRIQGAQLSATADKYRLNVAFRSTV